jgi:hypothetical protein
VTGVVVDPAGNACIIGRFTGRLPLGTNLLQSTGQWSAFVARFDRLGNCHGARQISGWAAVSPWAVAVDPHGHVLIAGDFGTPLDEPGSTLVCGESVLVSRGFVDAFVAKLESSLPIIEVSAAGSELLISWAWAGPELVLESSETVFGSTWIVRDEPVTHKSRRHTVRLSKGNTSQFFRLR